MRYEDTTQAGGIAQGQGPNAENDLDALTAGSRAPAIGNVITGDGTKSGAAGADSATDGHITSISGKSGTDSDFAGGRLSVDGDYGKLTIDADGNYRYVPNGTAPENSLDRFVYTLADAQGGSDAAVLTIEFGKTQSVIKTNAQQVVPGPDGVVVLPAGVQLSDIHIVGRNLVIDLPDGSQMVIIDGAVFVPQLSLDGVDVPSTNLAALLIGSEPKPAAGGEPPSSGGNFEVPVPPLDPGVPLGDLIPPTEYNYTPPEVREPLQDVDHEPSVTIQPDGGVAVEAATDAVNEAGLPERNEGEPEGSNSEATSETTGGTIFIDSLDDPNTVTINGVVVTSVGQVIHGQYGDLTITSISDGAIGYSYTLTDNTSGDDTHDDFTVVVTDVDGDSDTATLTIDIIDDVPTARPDTDQVAAGEFGPVTGNVITDAAAGDEGDGDNGADTVGADDASVTSVSGAGGSDSSFDEDGNLVVNGQYGVLTIDADGNYSYVRNEGSPGGVNDVFNYTITDGDGDTSSSTLTISIADLPPEITVEDKTPEDTGSDNLVYEDGLPARGSESEGSDAESNGESTTGTFTVGGGDGTLSIFINGSATAIAAGDTITTSKGTLHIDSIVNGVVTYTYTLTDNTSGDNTSDVFSLVVRDADGDTDTATLTIRIIDDVPSAADDFGSQDVEDAPITVDVFANDTPGADSVDIDNNPAVKVELVDGSLSGTGSVTYNNDGTFTYHPGPGEEGTITFDYTITDGDGDVSQATVTIELQDDSIPQVLVAEGSDTSVNEAGLPVRGSESEGSGEEAAAGANGDPSEAAAGTLIVTTGNDTVGKLEITDKDGNLVNVTNGGTVQGHYGTLVITGNPTDGYSYVYTLNDNTSGDATQDDFPILVTDSDGDTDDTTLTIHIVDDVPTARDDSATQGTEGAPITVNVINNDTRGADGVDIDNNPAVKVEMVDGSLSGAGSVVYNNDGTFTYTPAVGEEGTVTFDYTITDGDGDVSQATVTITLQRDSVPQVSGADNLVVDEDGLANANVDANPLQGNPGETDSTENATATGDFVVNYGNDVPANPLTAAVLLDSPALDGQLVTLNGTPVTFALNGSGQLVGTAGGQTVMIISITGASTNGSNVTYTYSAQLLQPVQHADVGNNENTDILSGVQVQVTDSDGDTGTATFSVTVVDDVPSATAVTVNQVGEDTNVTFDLHNYVTPGADGVNYAGVTYTTPAGAGSLSYNPATGVFTYDPAPGQTGTVTFSYTVTDGDGDEVTANVTLNLNPDSTPQVSGADNLVVDEDGLANANVDSNPLQGNPGETDSTESATQGGDFVVDYGNDLPANPLTAAVLVDGAGLDGQLVTLNGTPVTFALNGSGQLVGTAGGQTVMIISITGSSTVGSVVTYTYSAQLLQPVQHADVGNNENTDILSGVQVQVTDSDGDTATATFNVTVVDDVPSATAVSVNQVGEDANVTFDLHNYVTPGADGVNYANVTYSTPAGPGSLSYNPATGVFTYDPAPGQTGTVTFTYTVVDGDGDEVTANVTLNLNSDSVPQVSGADNLVVDEDGLANANVDANPLQGNPGETDSTENATATGDFVVNYGNDVPANPLTAAVLLDSPALDGQLVTLNGTPVTFALNGSGQLVGTAGGQTVMIISITGASTNGSNVTYTYSAQLLQPVQHADVGNNENTDILSGVQVQVTDSDGDTGTATFSVTVVDDVPSATAVTVNQVGEDTNVTFDLHNYVTPGADGVNYAGVTYTTPAGAGSLSYNPATGVFTYDPAPGQTGTVTFSYTVTDGDGDEVTANVTLNLNPDSTPSVGTPTNLTLDEDGFAFANADNSPLQSNPQEVDANEALTNSGTVVVSFGNDAPGGTLTNSITLVDTAALDGQLQLLNGSAVTFALVGGVLVGSADGMEVIRISVTAAVSGPGAGQVTYTYQAQLLQPLEHAPGAGENTDLLSGVTFQVTDSDGDTASGTFNVTVYDDVPSASASLTAPLDAIVVDETRPLGNELNGDNAPGGLASASAGFADNFVTAVPGADGATTAYSLVLNGSNVASGLYALQVGDVSASDGDGYGQGTQILLNYNAGTGVITGSANGLDYFTISINPTTGLVTFTQLEGRNVWHANTGSDDDTSTLTAALNSIQVQQTVTDGDGDVATATVDISRNVFQIEDDGPEGYTPAAVHATNGNTAPVIANLNLNMGTDGLGQLLFSTEYEGDPAMDSDGHALFLGGQPLYYHVVGNVLTATTAVGGGGTLGFTVTLNSNGTYTFDVNGTISNGTETSFTNLSDAAAGNVNWRGIGDGVANNNPDNIDLMLSASTSAGGTATVNTDADSIGSANNSIDGGESVRIDFVTNMNAGATPTGFNYDGHYSTNSFEQNISQVQGSQSETVAFRVYALDSTLTAAAAPDSSPVGGFSDATITTITSVMVKDYLTSAETTLDISAVAVGVWTTVAYGISVQKQADGSVIFTGVQEGDTYGIATGSNDFNAVVVRGEPVGTGATAATDSSTDSFDLGILSIGSASAGTPIVQDFNIIAIDGDGDPQAGVISTTIDPVVSGASAKTASFVSAEPVADNLMATNDNSVSSLDQSGSKHFAMESRMAQSANTNSFAVAAAVVGAAGLAAPAAADGGSNQSLELAGSDLAMKTAANADFELSGIQDFRSSISGETREMVKAEDTNLSVARFEQGGNNLDDHAVAIGHQQDMSQLLGGTTVEHAGGNVESLIAPMVGMPSAEMVALANVADGAQKAGLVEKVLVEAIANHGSPTVDHLLEAATGHAGQGGADLANAIASPDAGPVQGWDMAMAMGSHSAADVMFKVDASMLHHDAVQPTVHG